MAVCRVYEYEAQKQNSMQNVLQIEISNTWLWTLLSQIWSLCKTKLEDYIDKKYESQIIIIILWGQNQQTYELTEQWVNHSVASNIKDGLVDFFSE